MYNAATMIRLFKIFLIFIALLAGLYAATPLWLPMLLDRQLPPGWKLDTLQAGYPGMSGIDLKQIRVKGELQAATIELAAVDVKFRYQDLKTDIGSISLDVFLQTVNDNAAVTSTLDDLSLPTTKLTGKLPELSIGQAQLVLHTTEDVQKEASGI